MKRRELFGVGALGLTLGSSSCASSHAALRVESASADDLVPALGRIDRSLWFLDHPLAIPTIFRDVPPVRDDPDASRLARDALKSLLMLGFFRDVPEQVRSAPEVQRRMWEAAPAFETSVRGMAEFLKHLTPEALTQVRERLQREPDLPARIATMLESALDNEWVDDPLSTMRHVHLRSLVADITFRLKHQPVSLVVDEVVKRFARAGGFSEQDAVTREVLRAADGGNITLARLKRPCRGAWDCRDGEQCEKGRCGEPPSDSDFDTPFLVGLAVCGIGVVIFGGSLLLTFTPLGFAAFFGATLGALVILVGLIILTVTGLMMTAELIRGG